MEDRYEGLCRSLLDAIQGPLGVLDLRSRKTLLEGNPVEGPLGPFAAKVVHSAPTLRDEDVSELGAQGIDEESIFECVVVAAIGAGMHRLNCALRAVAADL
jgi:hypothetical protein